MKTPSKKLVSANLETLKAMGTPRELHTWAKAQGIDSASGFAAFKKALLAAGIDYDGMKQDAREARAAEATHSLILYSDAKWSADRYAVCDKEGNPVWFGKFFAQMASQAECELDAANKAVWFASKVKEAVGATSLRLTLYVDAQYLIYQDSPKQKGYELTKAADKFGIALDVQWIPGNENPADQYTVCAGFKKWSDNDLGSLAEVIAPAAEPSTTIADAAAIVAPVVMAAVAFGTQLSLF